MSKKITVIGLGSSELAQLPLGIYQHLKTQRVIYVRTKQHPVVEQLSEEGVSFVSFDDIYEKHDAFEAVYDEIVSILLAKEEDLTYAVPGHPFVAERTIQLLLEAEKEKKVELEFLGGQSFLDPLFTALKIDPIEGFELIDATQITSAHFSLKNHVIIAQVYDRFVASDVKLTLMERLPDDYEVTIVTAAGSKEEKIISVPLYELDRVTTLNNVTSVYVPPVKEETLLYGEFSTLKEVIATLRGPNGCPWDRKQTHQSLKKYLLEETYELLEAIDEDDIDHMIEELGDVLLQVMLHAQIGEDDGYFSIRDVIETITEKMIRRHPHVFANQSVTSTDELKKTWDEIKKQEKNTTEKRSLLSSVPKGLPSLMEAVRIQKKAAEVGFDWDDVAPMWTKLEEEVSEFQQEAKNEDIEKMKAEFGDVLFVLANVARHYDIDPEEALRMTNAKFKRRFQYMEEKAQRLGKPLTAMTLQQLDELWEEAKQEE